MVDHSIDWFAQAERDLEQAKSSQGENLEKKDTKFARMVKSEVIWTFSC